MASCTLLRQDVACSSCTVHDLHPVCPRCYKHRPCFYGNPLLHWCHLCHREDVCDSWKAAPSSHCCSPHITFTHLKFQQLQPFAPHHSQYDSFASPPLQGLKQAPCCLQNHHHTVDAAVGGPLLPPVFCLLPSVSTIPLLPAHTAVVKLAHVQTGCIHALGVFHPLLLEPSLPPLKEPPATEVVNYDAAASPSSSAAADSMGKASWEPQQPPRQIYGQRGRLKGKVPCPVDLLVPAGVKVVAVTGPNTGMMLTAPLLQKPPVMLPLGALFAWKLMNLGFCCSWLESRFLSFLHMFQLCWQF